MKEMPIINKWQKIRKWGRRHLGNTKLINGLLYDYLFHICSFHKSLKVWHGQIIVHRAYISLLSVYGPSTNVQPHMLDHCVHFKQLSFTFMTSLYL